MSFENLESTRLSSMLFSSWPDFTSHLKVNFCGAMEIKSFKLFDLLQHFIVHLISLKQGWVKFAYPLQ